MQITSMKYTVAMTTNEIAEQTGKRHDNVLRDTRKMLVELYGLDALLKFEATYDTSDGRVLDCYALPKNEVLILVSGYSIPLRAKIIRRLDELEKNNSINDSSKKEELELQLLGAKYVSEMLDFSKASKLEMVHGIYEDVGVSTRRLPIYTKDVRPTFSAKDLLERFGCGISSIAFNKLMISNGFMEEKTRTASKGKIKTFKILTKKGLEFGQNDTSKYNPREVQPHYYEDRFLELFNILTQEEEVLV